MTPGADPVRTWRQERLWLVVAFGAYIAGTIATWEHASWLLRLPATLLVFIAFEAVATARAARARADLRREDLQRRVKRLERAETLPAGSHERLAIVMAETGYRTAAAWEQVLEDGGA